MAQEEQVKPEREHQDNTGQGNGGQETPGGPNWRDTDVDTV